MARDRTCSADMFAVAFNEIMRDVERGIDRSLAPAVRAGCRSAKETTTTSAFSMWPYSSYPSGFSYKTEKSGLYCEGEVGNGTKPGLVHLLEKGHAKVGGGRTRAFRHVEPGYEAGAKEFQTVLLRGIDNAL